MTPQQDKPKRWRPRFSVRTLVILVTLVCVYAACWRATMAQGVADVAHRYWDFEIDTDAPHDLVAVFREWHCASSPLPFVVSNYHNAVPSSSRQYYFWFFGYVAKLPYERELV